MTNNNELKKSLEMRQENLIFLLKNKKDHLELEKQHQIYGAIKEIDYIIRMLKYTDEEDARDTSTVSVSNDSKQQVMTKILEREKKFSMPFKIKFQKDGL